MNFGTGDSHSSHLAEGNLHPILIFGGEEGMGMPPSPQNPISTFLIPILISILARSQIRQGI